MASGVVSSLVLGAVLLRAHAVSETILHPSNRRVVTCADGLLRPIWVSATKTMADCQGAAVVNDTDTYANAVQYASHGAVTQLNFGNGLIESMGHNIDLQPERMRLGSAAGAGNACGQAGDTWCLQFAYGTPATNNGNVTAQSIYARKADNNLLTLQQTYSYDALNRLTDFNEAVQAGGAGSWSQSNQYDRYGNRSATASIAQHVMTPSQQAWLSTANNRVVNSAAGALTYDNAGNLTNHPQLSGALTYDAENRLTAFGSAATYLYDGEGRRVKRSVNGVDTYYVYDGTGALAAEYGGVSSAVGRRYLTQDHLGSTRATTDALGVVKSRCDYLPFGDQIMALAAQGNRDLIPEYACTESEVTQKFTSKERDAETGLDYFGARYMSSAQGSFTSPDEFTGGIVDPFSGQQVGKPGPLPYADIGDPQTLNKYGYVRNNPLRLVDPDGHCFWDACVAEAIVTATAVTGALIYSAEQLGTAIGKYINSKQEDQSGNSAPPPTTGTQRQPQSTPAPPPSPPLGSGNQGDDRSGGGKTGRKQNADRAQSAETKLGQAKENLANLNKQNPRPEGFQKALQQAKDQVKHWTKKAAEESEEHARVNQR